MNIQVFADGEFDIGISHDGSKDVRPTAEINACGGIFSDDTAASLTNACCSVLLTGYGSTEAEARANLQAITRSLIENLSKTLESG